MVPKTEKQESKMTTSVQRTVSELRELSNDYSPINEHLFEIAQEIERNGGITAKAVEEMQNTLSDCLETAKRLSELLKGVAYEA